MAALIATRERERVGGPGHVHMEEVKERRGPGVDSALLGDDCGMRPSGTGDSPRAVVPRCAQERQGKGERELAGGPARGVVSACQREKER
jgi:hypothetical protein